MLPSPLLQSRMLWESRIRHPNLGPAAAAPADVLESLGTSNGCQASWMQPDILLNTLSKQKIADVSKEMDNADAADPPLALMPRGN